MRSRTCAWIVTSRAVVGSSAMMSFGLQANAMAMIILWRMPPENSWGYWFNRFSGDGIPTWRMSSMARVLASASLTLLWFLMTSVICFPIFTTGFKNVIGSWKIMDISFPRIWFMQASYALWFGKAASVISCLPNFTLPSVMEPFLASSPMTEYMVTLFPLPDSPTMPTASDSPTEKEMPRTAWTVPWSVSKSTCKSFTSSNAISHLLTVLRV